MLNLLVNSTALLCLFLYLILSVFRISYYTEAISGISITVGPKYFFPRASQFMLVQITLFKKRKADILSQTLVPSKNYLYNSKK